MENLIYLTVRGPPNAAKLLGVLKTAVIELAAKFHITSQGMEEHRAFIRPLLGIDFGSNSTLQAKH